ncbi:alpha/beta fold hydrolase [Novosphingobium sp. PASSN1]|uniref:alpha/beta fold hydrolase n=1 Tax=Novosphingobium sp. PASSN1 TaxID=2015561 RepID=UPI000BD4EBD5|nr:alpha/beta fold hydrolase [Novosphingobium sp. PASSN1]OYU35717.1 MAG: alpha/beta hydrolase [Novosphingobium sp. PASSN1]
MKRREILGSASAAMIGALGATATAKAPAPNTRSKTFLFVHGAWHCSIHWGLIVERLTAMGHVAAAIDLPGSGLKAAYPQAYLANDPAALQTESSALRDIGLDDYTNAAVRALEGLAREHGKVTLVGHSFGGLTITRTAERRPDLVSRLVYLTAFCPAQRPSGDAYAMLPENGSSLIGPAMIGDPAKIGAYRLDARSTDGAYLEICRKAFYNDLPMDTFLRFAAYLNADAPAKASSEDARGTTARWGRVPRSYVRCTLDQALPLALQDRMIREADALTPSNRFDVLTLESSHSPFASMPDKLASLLAGV